MGFHSSKGEYSEFISLCLTPPSHSPMIILVYINNIVNTIPRTLGSDRPMSVRIWPQSNELCTSGR